MAEFDVDLSALDNEYADVSVEDAGDYQDQTAPAPLQPGTYKLRVEEGGLRKNPDGELILDEGYPQVELKRLSVVEPAEEGQEPRQIYPFQNYSLKPQVGGPRKGSVPVIDLLRGFNDTLSIASGKEALQFLVDEIQNGGSFWVETDWVAKDSEAIKDAIEEAGGDLSDMDAAERKSLFKNAIIRGQKRFPKNGDYYVPEVTTKFGNTVQARVSLGRIYPASKAPEKVGPRNARKAA